MPAADAADERDTAPWLGPDVRRREREILARAAGMDDAALAAEIDRLIEANRAIHERDCLNLNPATNVMAPRAEAALARGLGTRASLGHAGEKYETGLEAIEAIEVIAASLAREVFRARFAEIRVPSGAMANLFAFMATCRPGDAIVVPPAAIGGHVTHQAPGAAGLYGLAVHEAPVDAEGYSVDLDGLARLVARVRPRLVTIGGSLNLLHHPVGEIRRIAEGAGARVLFDAAHLSGPIAGGQWPHPLAEGADLMTMSTYKSLGGPPGGLVLTNDAGLAARLDRIAFPGLTANNDAGRVAALALTLVDWRAFGPAYAEEMAVTARSLAAALYLEGAPVHFAGDVATRSHAFALDARAFGGGQAMARHLRRANLLACGIGLPGEAPGGDMAGLRLGTPEIVRRGLGPDEMGELAALIARALGPEPERVAPGVTALGRRFGGLRFAGPAG
jgi:glycine hydroxymethyltransferase